MTEEERVARAARRAGYHLLKAVWEVLTAVAVIMEELSARPEPESDEALGKPTRVEVE